MLLLDHSSRDSFTDGSGLNELGQGKLFVTSNEKKATTLGEPWPLFSWSILAGQVDDIVGEIELDGFEREIGVRDLFAKDHVAVAIVAGEGGGFVGPDGEVPNLELFGGDVLIVGLNQGDFVEKPVGSGVFGEILSAFGVENASVEGMAKPLFAAGELREVGGAERLVCFAYRIALMISFVVCLLHRTGGAGESQGRSEAECILALTAS